MMKSKTLGVLVAVLIVLGVLSYVTKQSRYSPVEGGGFTEILPEGLDPGGVQTLKGWLGSAPDDPVILERSGDGWVVASQWGWTAKEASVTRMLEDLAGLKGEKRSSSEDVLEDFLIDEDNGLHIVGLGAGGTELFHLVVGKVAAGRGAFVRTEGSNDVYLTSANLRSSYGLWGDSPAPPEGKHWVEMRVLQADRNEVDRITIREGSRELVLEKAFEEPEVPEPAEGEEAAAAPPGADRATYAWAASDGQPVDKNKADGILGTLCSLYANEIVDPEGSADYGLDDSARTATLTFADGETKTVYFGATDEEDKNVYLRVGESGNPARIYKSSVDRIFQDRDDLKPAES